MTPQAYVFLLFGFASLAEGYQSQAAWLYVIGALALVIVPVSAGLARWSLRGMQVVADAPWLVHTGDWVRVCFHIGSDGNNWHDVVQLLVCDRPTLPWFGWWRSRLSPFGWQMATGATRERTARLQFTSRGLHPLPPMRAQSAYPFALVACTRVLDWPLRILVVPSPEPVDALPWFQKVAGGTGCQQANVARGGVLPRGVRPYRSGDALRDVHWRASARLGALVTKEVENEAGETILLYLDMRQTVLNAPMQEHLVSVASTLYAAWRARGYTVVLTTQPAAMPDLSGYGACADQAFLALVQASADAALPDCDRGTYLISADAHCVGTVDAGHFIHCPASGPGVPGAAVSCPFGVPAGVALQEGC